MIAIPTVDGIASTATCRRTDINGNRIKVGAIVRLLSNRVGAIAYAVGSNGGTSCTGVIGACGCKHAERVALDALALSHPVYDKQPSEQLWLVCEVTLSPCVACADALIAAADRYGASLSVYYRNAHRDGAGVLRLAASGANVWQLP